MKTGLMAVALAGMLGSGAAMAAESRFDGNELLQQCQSYIKLVDGEKTNDFFSAGICAGFIQGVSNTVHFYSDDVEKDEKFCKPATVTNAQLVRIVVKYLQDNPKDLNQGRMTLVWMALMIAYPCK
jgi:hypothetical protein